MVLELTGFRNYQRNVSKQNRTLERLSTGYRINRSADDAAGLAISEKLQLQVSGTEQAGSNVKDAISLVQTGEAAMQEIHDMLGRLYTLAEQSSNGTYENEVDRENLQKEVSQLKSEIDRISETANYNGIPLLSGRPGVEGVEWSGEVMQVHKTLSNITGQTQRAKSVASWEGNVNLSDAVDGSYVEVNGVRFEFWSHNTQHDSSNGSVLVEVLSSESAQNKAGALQSAISTAISNVNNPNSTLYNPKSGLYGLDEKTVTVETDGRLIIKQSNKDCTPPGGPDSPLNNRSIQVSTGSAFQGFTITGKVSPDKTTYRLEPLNLNHITDGTKITLFEKEYTIQIAPEGAGTGWTPGSNVISISCDNAKDKQQVQDTNNFEKVHKKKDLIKAIKAIAVQEKAAIAVNISGNSGNPNEALMLIYNGDYPDDKRVDKNIIINNHPATLPTPSKVKASPTCEALEDRNASRTEQIDFSKLRQGDSITVNGKQYKFNVNGAADAAAIANALVTAFNGNPPANPQGLTASAVPAPDPIYQISFVAATPVDGDKIDVTYATDQEKEMEIPCNTFIFQIGASSEEKLELTIQNVSVRYLGISGVDVSAQEEAADSMDRIKKAVDQLSDNRGVLGAAQNRLEHTGDHLGVTGENLTDALSTIKDASMAKEVMAHTKNQILMESTQSMLAQSENLLRQRVQFFTNL